VQKCYVLKLWKVINTSISFLKFFFIVVVLLIILNDIRKNNILLIWKNSIYNCGISSKLSKMQFYRHLVLKYPIQAIPHKCASVSICNKIFKYFLMLKRLKWSSKRRQLMFVCCWLNILYNLNNFSQHHEV